LRQLLEERIDQVVLFSARQHDIAGQVVVSED
jgi:hypothetical protein